MKSKNDTLHVGRLKEQIKVQKKKVNQISRKLDGLQRMYTRVKRKTSPEATESRQISQKFHEDIQQHYIDRLKAEVDVLGAFKDVLEKVEQQED